MWNRTGQYFAAKRQAHHLTLGQLARMIGYANTSNGARRIVALERDSVTVPGLIDRVVNALGLDPASVDALIAEDRRGYAEAWEQWASEPVEPKLRFRPFAGLWCGAALPKELPHDQAIAYAGARATTTRWVHVLLWSRKEHVLCYPDGRTHTGITTVGDVAGPYSIPEHGRGFPFA